MREVKRMIPVYLCSLALVAACAAFASRGTALLTQVMAVQEPSLLPRVVVDPGHGGEDGGALAPGGVKESDLNLEMGLRLRDLLSFMGFPTEMTRETDQSIYSPEAGTVSEKKISDLKNRVALLAQTPDALLISVHQNMFSQGKYRGAQVFYGETQGSRSLAEQIQSVICGQLDPANHRKAKENQTAYLLKHIPCTGVLVECGFLSNPEEAALLQAPDYQIKLTAAISAGLFHFLLTQNTS